MTRARVLLFVPFVAALVLSGLAEASASPPSGGPPVRPAREPVLTRFDGVAISPDGRFVVDVEAPQSADESRDVPQHLVVREAATGASREIALPCGTRDGCTVTVPVWTHDSVSIAYVVHAKNAKTRTIERARIGAGPIVGRRVLSFAGTLGGLAFSPDDTRLAALAIPNARKEVGATQAGAAIVGEVGSVPDEQRIAVIPLAAPAVAYASPANLFVYEYDWLPRGGFVGTAAPGDGDENWWVARVYRFDAASATAQELYRPRSPQQQVATPRVSADGRYLAFVGGLMSDFGSTGGDLFTLDLRDPSAVPVDLTTNAPSSVTSFGWMCGSDDLLISRLRGSDSELVSTTGPSAATASTIDAAPVSLYASDGAGVSRACTTAPNGELRLAAIRESYVSAPEVAVGSPSAGGTIAWRALSHANAAVPAEATARSLTWSSDGATVQGWLLEPVRHRSGGETALVTVVHGGPAAASVPRFFGRGVLRDLLRHGYDLFLPNPRGSYGQGETFTAANVRDFGYGDLRDILTGIDEAERTDASIDDRRLGITGGSYGGYMSMWAVTQTQRFAAAVAGAGVSNWISYYGENGIDQWMIPYFGASAYDDPAIYRHSSPIEFIKNVKTPTFAYVGERDVECPAPQSLEFWHALATEGVPTSLVVYAGEGHRLRAPRDIADVTKRTLAWFDRYLTTP